MSAIKRKIKEYLDFYKNTNIAVRASIWFTICSILQKGISIITLPIFTRIMSTDSYGTYSIFLTWYNIFSAIITLNIHSDIFNKGLIDHKDAMDEYMTNQMGLLIALTSFYSILYLLFHSAISNVLNISEPLMILMLFEILGNAAMGLWYARKRFDYDYHKIVGMTLFISMSTPIIGIIAVLNTSYKAEAKIITNAIVPIIIAILLIICYGKKNKLFSHFSWWKTVVLASLPLLPHYLSLLLLNQSDKLMINYFTGTSDAAIYSVAHSAGLLMTIINSSINSSFVPWCYGKLKSHDETGIKKLCKSLLLIVLSVNILLIWVAPEAITVLAAPEYSSAKWCLVPIAMSVYFYFAYTLFVDIEIYYGANKYVAIASICATVLNLGLNFWLIPVYGFIAAAYTTLISYFATMLLHYFFLRHVMKINKIEVSSIFSIKQILLFGLVLVCCSAVAMLLYRLPLVRFMILGLIFIVVYIKRMSIIAVIRSMKRR